MAEEIRMTLTVNSVIDNLDDSGLPDGEPEINIFTTDGTLTVSDRGMRLAFTEESEGQKTNSALYVTDGRVILKKRGAVESDMTFAEGEESVSVYRVGPYAFDMQIKAKRVRNSLTDAGGEIGLIYSMNVGGQEKSVRLKISAKRK